MKKMVELALTGDVHACKFILERVIPIVKGRKIPLAITSSRTIVDLNEASISVLQKMFEGEITPEEAKTLSDVIEQRIQIILSTEIEPKMLELQKIVDNVRK